MNPETIDAVKEALAPLAEKIGEGAVYGWEVLVWGQFAEGLACVIGGGLATVAGVIAIVWAISTGRRLSEYDGFLIVCIAIGVVATIAVIIGVTFFCTGIIPMVAPEYAAIKFLLGTVN